MPDIGDVDGAVRRSGSARSSSSVGPSASARKRPAAAPSLPMKRGKQEWTCPLCGWRTHVADMITAKNTHIRTMHADERAVIKLIRCRRSERFVIPAATERVIWQCPCCPKAIVDTGTDYTARHLRAVRLAHRLAEHSSEDPAKFRTQHVGRRKAGTRSMMLKMRNRYMAEAISEATRSDHLLRPFCMSRPWVDELRRRRGQPVHARTTWACGTCRRMGPISYFKRVRCTPRHGERNTSQKALGVLRKALKAKKWAEWWPEIENEIRFKKGEPLETFAEFRGVVRRAATELKEPSSIWSP